MVGGGADGGASGDAGRRPVRRGRLGRRVSGPGQPGHEQVRIDDDAAMMGWSVVSGQSSVVSDRGSDGQMTTDK